MKNPVEGNKLFDTCDLIEYIEAVQSNIIDLWNTKYKRHYILNEIIKFEEERNESDPFEDALDIDDVDMGNDKFLCFIEDSYDVDLDEYNSLFEFHTELSEMSDYKYGGSVIREDYFVDYCMDELVQFGYIKDDMPGFIVIDYEGTADNMKDDYTEYSYNGSTYYYRG